MSISHGDFSYLQEFVRDRAAIVLESGKEYLAEARLAPVARTAGLASITDLMRVIRDEPHGALSTKVVEAMTTNETSFFRDVNPFQALRTHVLPALMRARARERELNVWCAASSSGQEPYSIAMVLDDAFPELASWRIRLVATDLSREMLRRSREGVYSQLEVNRGLPAKYLVKYFEQHGSDWQVKRSLRNRIEFTELNLGKPWPALPKLDVVFLRNVLIYFDVPTKRAILQRVKQILRPDGYVFLGGAETTMGVHDEFERTAVGTAWCYRPRG